METHTRTHTADRSPGAGRRIYGCVIGIVTRRDDDKQLVRVKIRLPDVGGQKETSWARVVSPLGGNSTGAPLVPPEGAAVLVMFEQGDQNRPVVLGGIWFSEDGQSQVPAAARGQADPVRQGRGTDIATGVQGAQLQEPSDPFGPQYPDNYVFKSPKAGHLIEVDDTEGAERISITHGKSGSWVELHPDGEIVIGAKGKRYSLVEGDDQTHTKGDQDVVVEGNATHKTNGIFKQTCAGFDLLTLGQWKATVAGNANFLANSLLLQVAAALNLTVGAALNMTVGGSANLQAQNLSAVVQGTTTIGPGSSPGPVVTTITHPFDYITGLPIIGVNEVLVG